MHAQSVNGTNLWGASFLKCIRYQQFYQLCRRLTQLPLSSNYVITTSSLQNKHPKLRLAWTVALVIESSPHHGIQGQEVIAAPSKHLHPHISPIDDFARNWQFTAYKRSWYVHRLLRVLNTKLSVQYSHHEVCPIFNLILTGFSQKNRDVVHAETIFSNTRVTAVQRWVAVQRNIHLIWIFMSYM